ncbi:MAG: alpha/beta hydrolase, partial [Myxococcales bacterium]
MISPSTLLLALGAALLGLALNALRPLRWPGVVSAASFFAGWLTDELAPHQLVVQVALVAGLVALGGLAQPAGWAGLALAGLAWVGLGLSLRRSRQAGPRLDQALREGLGDDYLERTGAAWRRSDGWRVDWGRVARVLPRRGRSVEVTRDLVFASPGGVPLRLDVYRRRGASGPAPTLIFVHGGGWVSGDKRAQGLLTVHRLAARGWTCLNINYRLSPGATFPAHLIDVKQAIRWARQEGLAHGCDPAFIALAGGSAGAHLASLAALTPDRPVYQPGFEPVDTSVQACVAYYGVFDFTDRHRHWPHRAFKLLLSWLVMKTSLDDDRALYDEASPIAQVSDRAPPFLVLHGDRDTLAPVEEGRAFVRALRSVSRAPVVYAELPGAQHAFEILPSVRSTVAVAAVERFLAYTYSEHRRQAGLLDAPPPVDRGRVDR